MLKQVFIFALGAASGAAITWWLTKRQYEEEMREQIEYTKILQEENENLRENPPENLNDSIEEHYKKALDQLGYDKASDEKEPFSMKVLPYVITLDEFGEKDDHDMETLYCYSDKIVTDEHDEVIEDVDSMIGYDSLKCFDKCEDDSVYVRNERLKTDYEILLVASKFSDLKKRPPNQVDES